MELEPKRDGNAPGSLSMGAPSYVFTIARIAEMFGKDEEWLHTIANDMESEDGCLRVCRTNDGSTRAFTSFKIDSLKELMPMYRKKRTAAETLSNAAAVLTVRIPCNTG